MQIRFLLILSSFKIQEQIQLSIQNIASNPLYNQFYIAPGAALTWVFNPANLPGSAVDSLSSNGFISFTAKLKPETKRGYYVKNHAIIAINSNAPMVTNTTSNYLSFPAAVVELAGSQISLRAYPNPFSNVTNIVVEGLTGKYDFELMDMTGRIVQRLNSITSGHFQLSRAGLASGVYAYRIYGNNIVFALGKLIIQ
jgi:hypothetical protein